MSAEEFIRGVVAGIAIGFAVGGGALIVMWELGWIQ